MVGEFYENMSAIVNEQGSQSNPLLFTNGVKQRCTMAATFVNYILCSNARDAFSNTDVGVYIKFKTTGKLPNLRRFQASTKVMKALIRELLFADDCALFTHTVEDMQILMDKFAASA